MTGAQQKHLTHWIGGKPWTGEAAQRGDIYNPATGQVSGTVGFASAAEVDAAVSAAAAAKACPIPRTEPRTYNISTGRAARLPARCS